MNKNKFAKGNDWLSKKCNECDRETYYKPCWHTLPKLCQACRIKKCKAHDNLRYFYHVSENLMNTEFNRQSLFNKFLVTFEADVASMFMTSKKLLDVQKLVDVNQKIKNIHHSSRNANEAVNKILLDKTLSILVLKIEKLLKKLEAEMRLSRSYSKNTYDYGCILKIYGGIRRHEL